MGMESPKTAGYPADDSYLGHCLPGRSWRDPASSSGQGRGASLLHPFVTPRRFIDPGTAKDPASREVTSRVRLETSRWSDRKTFIGGADLNRLGNLGENMPAEFHKLGIAFQYPENWTLDEEDALAGSQSVTVYSPGGAFWSVSIHPRSADPHQLAQAAVTVMKGEYEGLESEAVEEVLAGREMVGFNLNFFCLDLTNTAMIRCLRTDQATYAVFWQAEDHEFVELEAVFRAITTSLLNHPNP